MRSRTPPGLIAAIAIAASMLPALPASAAEIAYDCADDICLVDPDDPAQTSNLTETAAGAGYEGFPVFSPDGDRIAYRGLYIASGFEDWNVYVIDPAEAAPRSAIDVSQAGDRDMDFERPAWSPDGTRLAWSSTADSSTDPVQDEVFVGAAAGTSPSFPVGEREGSHPTWSADGTRIAFGSGPEGIYTTSALAPGPSTYLGNGIGLEPVFSPDGSWVAAHRRNSYPYKVRVIAADGSGSRELAKPIDLSSSIDWSPDSTRLAYVGDEISAPDQVWVVPADGSEEGVRIPLPSGWLVPHDPVFSPDGTRVAFTARAPGDPGYQQILVAPADGSAAATPITFSPQDNEEPDWKPGGSDPGQAQSGGGGAGGGPGGGGASGGSGGGAPPATQAPVKVKLALFRRPRIVGGHVLVAGINCNAEGAHPTGWVAAFCAAGGRAYAEGAVPAGARPRARSSSATRLLFAKGSVRVPEGKTRPLKLKITAAGRRLLKAAGTLKVEVSITVRHGADEPTRTVRKVRLKAPPRKQR